MNPEIPTVVISADQRPPSLLDGLRGLVRLAVRHAFPVTQMTRRELAVRYRGSVIGFAWSFATPLLMLGIYTFMFGYLFRPRGGAASDDLGAFAMSLFVGLILHGLLSECMARGPTLILANPNYVKKFVFPLEILALPVVLSAVVQACFGVVVLLACQLAALHTLPWTALLLPAVLAPFTLLLAGVVWLLAALGVFVRDIQQITGVVTSVLMFLAPILYPIEALPATLRPWLYLNPLTLPVEEARKLLLKGELPDWGALAVYAGVAMIAAWIGYWVFARLKRAFADVV